MLTAALFVLGLPAFAQGNRESAAPSALSSVEFTGEESSLWIGGWADARSRRWLHPGDDTFPGWTTKPEHAAAFGVLPADFTDAVWGANEWATPGTSGIRRVSGVVVADSAQASATSDSRAGGGLSTLPVIPQTPDESRPEWLRDVPPLFPSDEPGDRTWRLSGWPQEGAANPSALPERPRLSWRDDVRILLPSLREDLRAVSHPNNWVFLAASAGAAIGIHQDLDGRVARNTARHPERWGGFSEALSIVGNYPVQVPVILGVYSYSLWTDDEPLHDMSRSLVNAYILTAGVTTVLKVLVDTDRPSDRFQDGRFGFPSFHTSSSFAIAAVLDEYYGPRAALPAYTVAGLVGWSRIDRRAHDLSDVVFGAALGYTIGRAVAGYHRRGDSRVMLWPVVDPVNESVSMMFSVAY